MSSVAPLLAALALAANPAPASPAKAPPPPWERPAFTAPAAEIARSAAALPAPAGKKAQLDVLLEEGIFTFDEQGRLSYAYRMVYRPLTRAAAESWAEAGRSWAPWHEERPSVRARTILEDGSEHVLDPRTLSEGPADPGGEQMYSDARVLRAPIPMIAPRAVVEEESVVKELAPLIDRGTVKRFWIGRDGVTRRIRLVISAPEKLPLRYALRGGLDAAPVERREKGRRILEWSFADVAAAERSAANSPPERASGPHVVFGTGTSWQAVAARYTELTEKQLAGADLAAKAREIAGGVKDRREAAQALLDWISARVRYTGLELGQAAIVPTPPATVLERGYGDCKDLSLLLAGMLRALGHPAELALLRTASDDPADLPGANEFNHVIVHVPGTPELWIDATDPDTAAGELPPGDQGKLVLLASPATKGLLRTPDMPAAANRSELTREIVLAEVGRAKATETRLLRGSRAAAERRAHRHATADALRQQDETDAGQLFAEGKLTAAAREGLDRPGGPVTVRLEAEGSRWAVTGDLDAEAVASPEPIFQRLPAAIRPPSGGDGEAAKADARPDRDDEDEEGDGEDDEGGAGKADADRPREVMLPEAFDLLLGYRIVPPPGFQADGLPDPRKVVAGPATYERTASLEADGVVRISHRFTVSRRRLSAKEVEGLRAALAEFTAEDGPRVKFARLSEKLLSEGKGREALEELRRLIALHPAEARHHAHLSLALLRLGMGEAARKAARVAAEVEPQNGWAHRIVANALAHDLLGRYLQPGCDLAGAVAAQRRAAELEKDATVRAHLALLLEHGDRCVRWGPGAKLDEAIQVLRSIRTELKNKDSDTDLLEAYLRAERYADARALAKELKDGPERRAALLACAAALDGPPAVAKEAARIAVADRAAALQAAVAPLLATRRYPEAAALLEAAAVGTTDSAQLKARAALLARIRRTEAVTYDPADPATLFPRVMREVLTRDAPDLTPFVAGSAEDAAGAARDFRQGFDQTFRADRALGLPVTAGMDIALSLLEWSKEGDDASGWRIRYTLPFNANPIVIHALKEPGGYRIVTRSPEFAALARAARALAEGGKLAPARRLLGFARDAAPRTGEASPGGVLAALWTRGDAAGQEELRVAALALEAGLGEAAAVRRVEELRRLEKDPARRRALGWAILFGQLAAKRWEPAAALAGELGTGDGAERAFDARALALVQLGRRDALRVAVEARRKAAPDDPEPLRWLRRGAIQAGDARDALAAGRRVIDTGRGDAGDHNEVAWAALFLEPLVPDVLEVARRGVMMSGEKNAAVLHTLAMVYAERGEPAEALQVLVKSIAARDGSEPMAYDWLVVGRVAEHYGLTDEAVAAYRRVTARPEDGLDSAALAARRLGKLGEPAKPPAAAAARPST